MPDAFLQKWQTLNTHQDRSAFIHQALSDKESPNSFARLMPKFDRLLEENQAPPELLNAVQRVRKQQELKLEDCLKPRRGFTCQKSWDQLVITDQRDECPELSNIINHPDTFIQQGKIIKSGKATTVAIISSGQKQYFIKRYNPKGFLYSLTRSLIPSRAAVTWHAAQLLESIGIPTARPVALLEKRWGPFKQTSYVIHEYIDSIHAMKYFAEGANPQPEWKEAAKEISDILYTLKRSMIIHGDLKAHNFIIQNHHAYLIDLDSLQSFQSVSHFSKKRSKDLERFQRNWNEEPEIKLLFSRLDKELRDYA
ncbi:lipopolysaccharide kinase InaA family protein [Endozoicomonas numazuensis]|uniref:Non-specific serine/threonine protein kinase n=1 Tax=Endozoicomonas numazuensis TaxID=1137799 RepID=A0A081NIL9_9GAMM|nr:lipopolysaccharide kinase InaA family protein [Endozoicomonas numazuensis]KEQ18292.1 hypothetical protein GZ78_12280 [Endozoicomonas numazuensis]